jgi:cytochrome c oxidase subunit 2
MRFRVVVVPQAEFDAWIARQKEVAAVPGDPLAKEGHDLFMSNEARCFACHTIAGTQKARGTVGPNLTHFASRQHLAAGNLENTQENVRIWLEDPEQIKPGNIMSRDAAVYNGQGEPLTEPQISALVAFLRSLE